MLAEPAVIETARLRLEPLEPRHAAALWDGLQQAEVYEFLDEGPPASLPALDERYARLATTWSPDRRDRWLNWAIVARVSGSYLGYVQATVHPDTSAEVAYVLFPSAWGQGFGGEAVAAMIEDLQTRFGATHLTARVAAANRRSIALLKRLGFVAALPDSESEASEVRFERRLSASGQHR